MTALVVFATAAGVRGSDQYWYLSDAERLARYGVATTMTLFPVGLLGPAGTLSPPFIHNVLSTYLAGGLAVALGGYGGWIALNVAAVLATSLLIFLTARRVASDWAAIIVAVLYPLLPVIFWHTTQPLTEASTALFAALALYLLGRAGEAPSRWLAVVGATGLLYFCRDSYLPLLLAVPVGYLVTRVHQDRGHLRAALPPTVLLGLGVVVVLLLGQALFPADNVAFSYSRLVQTAVPGMTDNMWFNFDLSNANIADTAPIRWDLLPGKLLGHLTDQVVGFESLPIGVFYWTFNLLALVAAAMLWRTRHQPDRLRLVIAALGFVAVHLVTITLFQNEVRYTVPAIPGLLVVSAMALSDIPWLARLVAPRTLLVVAVLIVVALIPDVWIARVQRADAATYGAVEAAARDVWDANVDPGASAMIVYADRSQVIAYAAGQRSMLYISSSYSKADLERLRSVFPTHWLLAPIDSSVITSIGASQTPVATLHGIGVDWGLFRLQP